MTAIDEIALSAGVIPVLEVEALEQAAPLARALSAGGLRVVELTLRTACALDALKAMQDAAPDLIVGMGTIRSERDVAASRAAGAAFLVSPGVGAGLLQAMADSGAPALPGVATASEAMTACDAGFHFLKFFPAEPAGGAPYLKSLAGPLPDVRFCPTGGISAAKANEYLALSNVVCVGGSWIATKAMIAAGDWKSIEDNARAAASLK
ncbi:MAG: bifunctional 4-hydroxy-2-oxoglutarate aldolase/2-dehydro-3-deoxy-phosphogluconate aldolase [Oricola sp.]|jgi:2-dehydro-3-deoxyphosphogluconate aldolase / (4S)-4-hydroxy-2-oxoglutarate aldolase|nr:bifunctional 4-hydroxy-2-oxoglutarate aldolase/2-dehydro-3-deoxy-phosphogluconate aldolase [Oricola sp.]